MAWDEPSEAYEFATQVLRETPKALQIAPWGIPTWLPKSQISLRSNGESDTLLCIPMWLARKIALVGPHEEIL